MIFIAVGANLPSARFGPPKATCEAALMAINSNKVKVLRRSRWYRSAPVPVSRQPDFINGVAELETTLSPEALLEQLHRIEDNLGRVRRETNEARAIDLDIIAYNDLVTEADQRPTLPHPRMHERAFVVIPLLEIAPNWRHPILKLSLRELREQLPPAQIVEPVEDNLA